MADQSTLSTAPAMADLKYADEASLVNRLLARSPLSAEERASALSEARDLVRHARALDRRRGVVESFLEEFSLGNSEGLALMCLAEALLRIPDQETADKLIAEKIRTGDWAAHRGQSDNLFVNVSTWGMMLTGRYVALGPDIRDNPGVFMRRLVARLGEPVVRAAMMQAMRIMGGQFVLGRTIDGALRRGRGFVKQGLADNYSFDMLGEGARTAADADRYYEAYARAIEEVGAASEGRGPDEASGISVKLSALHPRYEERQRGRALAELYPKIAALAALAAKRNIHFTLDAEEADRLELSLDLFAKLTRERELADWTGLGLAVQAYQKRALSVIDRIDALAIETGRRFMVRLVKGAYWDSEIKRAQSAGRPDFPVFTTKAATDLSYLACARRLFAASARLYPQFATHNAHSLAAIKVMAKAAGNPDYEFQRLHGMGEALYEAAGKIGRPRLRVYAPVGAHEDLLPYLVRRLLENGANTSFVHAFLDEAVPVDEVVRDPIAVLEAGPLRHPRIAAPPALYGATRRNSAGLDLSHAPDVQKLQAAIAAPMPAIEASPIIAGQAIGGRKAAPVLNPANVHQILGSVAEAEGEDIERAFAVGAAYQPTWDGLGAAVRAKHLRAMADALEADMARLIVLMGREAGKTLQDGVDEVREAVDFCRYYASEAERQFGAPVRLPGPAGETNHLSLHGRGVFVCISPWNFPLAIFTGQIAAALAAGNCVIAKPAEQTPLIAAEAVRLFLRAGLPAEALALLPGRGETIGAALTRHPRAAGVAFTGSSEVARAINRSLAAREGPIAPLIAETGGLNGMFVDTSALREQVIDDAILSAFGSAGQRCSALRVLFAPREVADGLIKGLSGAMEELTLGDPLALTTDVGPIIDAQARAGLERHLAAMTAKGAKVIAQRDPGAAGESGHFFGPTLIEIPSLDLLEREVFGPILHVVRYDPAQIIAIGGELAAKGYGLTLGVHTRLEEFVAEVRKAAPAGNCYVNRSMIGAVVGVQPFGGEGLSGTGPKAGGPLYLARFATERVVSVNIAAQGGDPELINLS